MNYGVSTPSTTAGSLMVLAPTADSIPDTFQSVHVDGGEHAHLLAAVQRLRGSVYLDDGAITRAQLTPDGRHEQAADERSWHIVSVEPNGSVTACARCFPHPRDVEPEDLGVWTSALADDPVWSQALRKAVEHDIDSARRSGLSYVELGGWAVSRMRRGTWHAFETAVSTYALTAGLGGCIGITTATVRHCSSLILRRLGGRSLELAGLPLPSYFDPKYGCEMEILRFDSRAPNRRYSASVERMAARFASIPVIAAPPVVRDVSEPSQSTPVLAALADRFLPSFLPQGGYAAAAV